MNFEDYETLMYYLQDDEKYGFMALAYWKNDLRALERSNLEETRKNLKLALRSIDEMIEVSSDVENQV